MGKVRVQNFLVQSSLTKQQQKTSVNSFLDQICLRPCMSHPVSLSLPFFTSIKYQVISKDSFDSKIQFVKKLDMLVRMIISRGCRYELDSPSIQFVSQQRASMITLMYLQYFLAFIKAFCLACVSISVVQCMFIPQQSGWGALVTCEIIALCISFRDPQGYQEERAYSLVSPVFLRIWELR